MSVKNLKARVKDKEDVSERDSEASEESPAWFDLSEQRSRKREQ